MLKIAHAKNYHACLFFLFEVACDVFCAFGRHKLHEDINFQKEDFNVYKNLLYNQIIHGMSKNQNVKIIETGGLKRC